MFFHQSRRVARSFVFLSLMAVTLAGCDLGTYASRSSESGGVAAPPAGSNTQTPPATAEGSESK